MRGFKKPHTRKKHKCYNKYDSAGAMHFLQFFIWSALRKKAEASAEANAFTCSLVCNAEESGRFAEDIAEAISLQLFCLHSGRKRKVCGR